MYKKILLLNTKSSYYSSKNDYENIFDKKEKIKNPQEIDKSKKKVIDYIVEKGLDSAFLSFDFLELIKIKESENLFDLLNKIIKVNFADERIDNSYRNSIPFILNKDNKKRLALKTKAINIASNEIMDFLLKMDDHYSCCNPHKSIFDIFYDYNKSYYLDRFIERKEKTNSIEKGIINSQYEYQRESQYREKERLNDKIKKDFNDDLKIIKTLITKEFCSFLSFNMNKKELKELVEKVINKKIEELKKATETEKENRFDFDNIYIKKELYLVRRIDRSNYKENFQTYILIQKDFDITSGCKSMFVEYELTNYIHNIDSNINIIYDILKNEFAYSRRNMMSTIFDNNIEIFHKKSDAKNYIEKQKKFYNKKTKKSS